MKKKILVSVITMIAGCLILLPKTHASLFGFQPRLETGLLYYSIELTALSETNLPVAGETTGHNLGHDKIKFSDHMRFVGGGATFFINRLFVDLSAQYAFDGNSRSQDWVSEYSEATNSFVTATAEDAAQFDRIDRAISIGCAINRRFSVYAGYKWATLELDSTFDGPISYLDIDNFVMNGSINGEDRYKFEYEGPFVGLTNGWEIGHRGFLHGLISAKLALAYLNSKLHQDETGAVTFDSINGAQVDPIYLPLDVKQTIKGTTWGLALGLDWRGETPIGNLAYCIGVNGYRFNFNSDDSTFSDISETSVIFKVGLSYAY